LTKAQNTYWRNNRFFNKRCWRNCTHINLQKTETRFLSLTCTNINSKGLKNFNEGPETFKMLQYRVGKTQEHTGIANNFLNRNLVAQELREVIDSWDCIKLKSFCTTKEIVSRLNRHPTEWKKIFASYTCDKGLKTKIYRVIVKITFQRITT
jgi:hypothetical protein